MGDKNFSTELRRLRILANLTLRGLAKKVDVDFSYLNKIENGVLPPPSEKVITKLAKALKVNKEELMDLAGRLPHDLIKFLKSKAKSEFGSTVRARRIKAKLTQEDLAKILDIDTTYLSKIESGIKPPPREKVIGRMAEALNFDKEELLWLAGKIPSVDYKIKHRKEL